MKKESFKVLNVSLMMLVALSLMFVASCKKEETPPDPPLATFQFQVDGTNPLMVAFTNFSSNATSYSWDFGDGVGTSTETNPTYTYQDGGTYTVKLTATGDGGTAEHTKEVTVIKPGGTNLIKNGEFDDDSEWAIFQHNGNNAGTVTIANGVAVFNQGIQGEWGSEPHVGINQSIDVPGGSYQFDLEITTNGINEVWFEVWVGPNAPVDGEEYNDANGATRVLSFNTWACPENATYTGQMAPEDCEGTDGLIDLDAGTYYVVIRSGGITCSADGITIDNVTMVGI
jgi:PKD repeat protein